MSEDLTISNVHPPRRTGPQLAGHVVHILLPLQATGGTGKKELNDPSRLTLAGMAHGVFPLVDPARLRGSASAVFEAAQMSIGDDLQDSVAKAFGVEARQGEMARSIPCWKLTQTGRNVVSGEALRPPGNPRGMPGFRTGSGLLLPLSGRARKRMAAAGVEPPTALVLKIEALDVVFLSSGIGFALVQVGIGGETGLDALQELLHAIAQGNRPNLLWACRDDDQPAFNLTTLVGALLAPASLTLRPRNRLFTYTVLRCAAFWPGVDAAALRLSRHYTSDYLVEAANTAADDTVLLRPFEAVLHAVSLEGAVTLLSEESVHTAHGATGTTAQRYLVLAILAYHEHVILLDLAQQAAGSGSAEAGDGAAVARDRSALTALVTRFLVLRRHFRVPLASEVTMHNQVYDALRRVLRNDELERRIAQDIAQVSERLNVLAQQEEAREAAQRERERAIEQQRRAAAARVIRRELERTERNRAPLEGILASTLTFLTSVAAAKEVRTLVGEHVAIKGAHWIDIGIFALCLLLAAIAGWYAASRHRDKHSEALEEDDVEPRREHQRDEGVHAAIEGQETQHHG